MIGRKDRRFIFPSLVIIVVTVVLSYVVKGVQSNLKADNISPFKRIGARQKHNLSRAVYLGDLLTNGRPAQLNIIVDRAADAVETWLIDGIDLAMTRHNGVIEQI